VYSGRSNPLFWEKIQIARGFKKKIPRPPKFFHPYKKIQTPPPLFEKCLSPAWSFGKIKSDHSKKIKFAST